MSLYGGINLVDRPDPENIRRLDLLQLPALRKMHRYGFRIDPEHFKDLSFRLTTRMSELRKDIVNVIPADSLDRFVDLAETIDPDLDGNDYYEDSEMEIRDQIPPEFNVESSVKIAELLYTVLRLNETAGVAVKKTKGGDRLSTGKKTLEQLKRSHPVVPLILEYREASKLDGTYARTLPVHARTHLRGKDCPVCGRFHWEDERRVHTTFTTTRAITGRICSKNPNLANIPARSKLGGLIRAGFIASRGCRLVQRDWAQIELRLMADRSGDPVMVQVYLDDGDIHIVTAQKTFGIDDPAKVDKLLHRAPSKNTNFAVCYLITGSGLLDLMAVTFATANKPIPDWLTEDWCDDFIQKWFGVYKGVKTYLDNEGEFARRYGLVCTRMGRVRRIPGVRSALPYIQEAGIREGCNHGIQGFSADLMKLGMGELNELIEIYAQHGVNVYPLMTIYDEIINEVPEDHCEMVQAGMAGIMDNVLVDRQTGVLQCLVPIQSDGKIMSYWSKD